MTLDLNGGTGVDTELTGEAVGSFTFDLPIDVPKKNGYIFAGWAESEQSTKLYFRGHQYETSSETSKLVAVYKPIGVNNDFNLTLVYYSGTDDVVITSSSNASTCAFKLPIEGDSGFKNRTGFTFLGWSLTKGGEILDSVQYYAESLNDTLYAVWKSNTSASPTASVEYSLSDYEVKFDASGSSNAISFLWTFGDGSTGSGKLVSHTYTSPGKYKVTLTVYSSSNFEDVKTFYVTVPEGGESDGSNIGLAVGIVCVTIIGLLIARFAGVI